MEGRCGCICSGGYEGVSAEAFMHSARAHAYTFAQKKKIARAQPQKMTNDKCTTHSAKTETFSRMKDIFSYCFFFVCLVFRTYFTDPSTYIDRHSHIHAQTSMHTCTIPGYSGFYSQRRNNEQNECIMKNPPCFDEMINDIRNES